MKMKMRILCYATAIVIGTIVIAYLAVASSRANMENDPSSMAWTGFLPFLLPLFAVQASIFVMPVAIITEAAVWLWHDFGK